MKTSLLFLVHRIPYPPDKGDKIRSYHLLRHLSQRFRIFLGAFVDDPADWDHEPTLRALCQDLCLVGIRPTRRKLASLSGLFNREPLSVSYYRNQQLQRWVEETLDRESIERALVFSSPMAQYVLGEGGNALHRVIDFVDVDSEKWRQYGRQAPWPMSWLYRWEGKALRRWERRVAADFDASVFVTREEEELFCSFAPEARERVRHVNNGVDTEFFSPEGIYLDPYPLESKVLVFTGAMDYWANVDAVTWFAREVFPEVRARVSNALFFIVGARPSERVLGLAAMPGVTVTGQVHDIRPYLAHARASVAPLRVARGVQNKVLEAWAMAKPVLATPSALEGLCLPDGLERFAAEDPETLVARCVELLEADAGAIGRLGRTARELVIRRYDWSAHLEAFDRLLGLEAAEPSLLPQGCSR